MARVPRQFQGKKGFFQKWCCGNWVGAAAQSLSRAWLLRDPMDCSSPSSSVHGISQARTLEWVAIPFSRRVFLTQGLHLGLPHGKEILYQLSHQGSPIYFLLSENILHCLLHLNIVKKSVCSFMGRSGGWILKWPGNIVILFGSSPFVSVESVFSKELFGCSKASWHVAWCWLGTEANQGKDGALGSQVAWHSWTWLSLLGMQHCRKELLLGPWDFLFQELVLSLMPQLAWLCLCWEKWPS